MAYSAKVILDSVHPGGQRLITLELDYWRAIHAELLTHRGFSRSASGSRAVPVEKVMQRVLDDPAMPVFWARNQRGMQAVEELDETAKQQALAEWMRARNFAGWRARRLIQIGLHKALANRLLEPWGHIQVVVTTTMPALENFFMLRCHPAAQQEMQVLAENMLAAVKASDPVELRWGMWHLPYLTDHERYCMPPSDPDREIRWSVARVARVSYAKHGTTRIDYAEDEALHDKLRAMGHMGPFEHIARADQEALSVASEKCGNFGRACGWVQWRKCLPDEEIFRDNPRREEIQAALYGWERR